MYRFLLPLFLSSPFISISQGKLTGTVQSFNNHEPILYANIILIGRQVGSYSDETGAFEIAARDNDSLTFSSAGYKRITLCVADIKKLNNQILLYPDTTQFPLFTTLAKSGKGKTEKKKFGYLKADAPHPVSNTMSGSQYAVFIKNDSRQEGLIESVLLGIDADKKSRIRIRLYEPVKGNGIGKEITKQNILADIAGNHKSFTIDISRYQIPFPEKGIVACVELLGEVDKDGKITKEPSLKARLYLTNGNDAERNTWTSNRDRRFVRESFGSQRQININAAIGLSAIFFVED